MMMPARFPSELPPALIVVVDTEEEFDWLVPRYDRRAHSIRHLARIGDLQDVFEAHGVRPVYAVDYPVASQRQGIDALGPIIADGRALLAAHLHPWVSPPFDEQICAANSYPGNLPRAQEAEKLRVLADCIETAFAERPLIYRAGRHGIGINTFGILESLGFEIDLTPAPGFDFSEDGGPDYSTSKLDPTWVGPHGRILSIPGTSALVGVWPDHRLYRCLARPRLKAWRLPGVAARLRMVERMRLSPEGQTLAEMRRLTLWLHRRGVRLFMLSLHSPSIEPGHTPFVRDQADRRELFARLDGYLAFFHHRLGGIATEPLSMRMLLRTTGGPRLHTKQPDAEDQKAATTPSPRGSTAPSIMPEGCRTTAPT